MLKVRILVGDKVIAVAGKDKGRVGKVLKVVRDKARNEAFCLVEGLAMQTHFVKANPNANEPGGKKLKEGLINISNLALVDSEGKPSRVGYKLAEDGTKLRYLKTTGETVVAEK